MKSAGAERRRREPIQRWRTPSEIVLATIVAAFPLLWVAIANGYPLVFADTGAYLATGFELRYPLDRSPVYGLTLMPFTRLQGLWLVAILQCVATSAVVAAVLAVVRPRLAVSELIVTCVLLAGTSTLPWFTGQIMPDVATGWVALLTFVTIAASSHQVALRWGAGAALVVAVAVHLSHILLAGVLIGGSGVALMALRQSLGAVVRRCLPATLALAIATLGLSAMNGIAAGRFTPSLSTRMFTRARLFDGRLAQPVLARRCATEQLLLCATASLVDDPRSAKPGQDWLWDPRSALPMLSARAPSRIRAEETLLINDTLRDRPGAVVILALRGWAEQLTLAQPGQLPPYPARYRVTQEIATYLPGEAGAYRASRQQQGTLRGLLAVPYVPIASAILLLAPLLLWRTLRSRQFALAGLTGTVVTAVIANAAITGALSGPDDRYQARIVWLLPLLAIVAWLDRARVIEGRSPALD